MPALGVDHVHEVAHLRGHIEELAVLAQEHAFGLGAGRDLVHDDVLVHVDDGKRRALFVGDVDAPPLFVDGEGLRARAGRELSHHLELGHVDDVDHVVIAAGDVELAAVGVEMHVARAPRGLDILHHLVGLGIEHDQVVGLLVADEDQAGILGVADLRRRDGTATSAAKDEKPNARMAETIRCVAASVRRIKVNGQDDRAGMDRTIRKTVPALLLDNVVKTLWARPRR